MISIINSFWLNASDGLLNASDGLLNASDDLLNASDSQEDSVKNILPFRKECLILHFIKVKKQI